MLRQHTSTCTVHQMVRVELFRRLFHVGFLNSQRVQCAFFASSSRMKPRELHLYRKKILKTLPENPERGDSSALSAAVGRLQDHDWFIRKSAIDLLGKVAERSDDEALQLIERHLGDSDIFVREASVLAVVQVVGRDFPDGRAVAALAPRLQDEDCFVRRQTVIAIAALGTPGDNNALSLILPLLRDGFIPVRKESVEAIVHLAGLEPQTRQVALEHLKATVDDSDKDVRESSRRAIEKLQQ